MRFVFTLFVSALTLFAGPLSGRRAPSFTLPDLNVNYHDLYDYRGKIVMLDIIQTTCPVCQTSQKIFETIRLKHGGKVAVINIVTQPDTQDTVRMFISQFAVKTPVLFDCGQAIASFLKLTPKNPQISLPHLFLIDGSGMIRNDYDYTTFPDVFEKLDPLMNEVTGLVNEMTGARNAPAPKAPAGPTKPPAPAAPKKQ